MVIQLKSGPIELNDEEASHPDIQEGIRLRSASVYPGSRSLLVWCALRAEGVTTYKGEVVTEEMVRAALRQAEAAHV